MSNVNPFTWNGNKYKNQKVEIDGEKFDSKKEAKRWCELVMLEKAGVISRLERQKKYELIPVLKDKDGRVLERSCSYIADFAYYDNEMKKVVVEDVKGYVNTTSPAYAKYVIKRKLMLWLHGIQITEI